jgi:uncharacterized protein (DUF2062 family)
VFKRRKQRSYARAFGEGLYPRGGWKRAVSYVLHRLRRLPDPPHKISRGIAAGIFMCFTPFFGLHIILAMVLAWVMQGNILAAVLATFFGNPITLPIIATFAVELGSWMLGQPGGLPLPEIAREFSEASVELWANFTAIFTDDVVHWGRLDRFYLHVFKPYFVGGMVPGVFAGLLAYVLSRPVIAAYQKARMKRLKKKYKKRRDAEAAEADAAAQ